MEINITEFKEVEAFTYSHSQAEGGSNAGRNTWNAAKSAPIQLLKTEAERAAFRRHMADYGAWTEKEIAAWSDAELNGLLVQIIAGDIWEAGADTLGGIDWNEYTAQSEAGKVAGNFFRVDGKYYYQLSY